MAGAALVNARLSLGARCTFALAPWLLIASLGCGPSSGRPLTVWAVDGQEWLAADTPPALENPLFSAARREIDLTAAINETLGFQLALRTETPPIGPYVIEISDLVGPGGGLSTAAPVSLYRIHSVPVAQFRSWYPEHTGRPATPTWFPDILVPWVAPKGGGPVLLDGPENELVWVDLRVPPTAAPGVYTAQLTVRPVPPPKPEFLSFKPPPPSYTCNLRLRVLPVALPSERSLPAICRVDPRDLLVAHLNWPREPAGQTRLVRDAPQQQAALHLVDAMMQLLQEHRTTPVLWASFPKLRPVGERRVEVEWEPYDQLIEGWLSGDAFTDLVGLSHWPIPASLDHPEARPEGGLTAPGYARLLAAYLAECRRHFEERGWGERCFVRLCPPTELTSDAVERVRRVGAILRQSETGLPLVAHLPARSLRGLGWRNAPVIELSDVGIWAPPAMWFEPEAMQQERALGRATWLMPDQPPYSGSLAVEALPTDAQVLPWLAGRYEVGALWIEHAAELGAVTENWPSGRQGAADCLIYPGSPYGLYDRPIPSVRLKRLRRGLQDHALLSLLERRGQRRLARSLAEQVVRWACTEACLDHLLDGKQTGWPREARTFALARELMLQELVGEIAPVADGESTQVARLAEWEFVMNQATRVRAAVEGVRLSPVGPALRAHILCSALNYTNQPVTGRWEMPAPPVGWTPPAAPSTTLPPNTRRLTPLEVSLSGLAYNTDGVYPFELRLDTTTLGAFAVPARLAIAACPYIEPAPTVDGNFSDWPLASNNAAGDFQLVRGQRAVPPPARADRPALPTQAFFCCDRERLYVAIRCWLAEGEPPVWRGDNRVPLEGAVPWEQDVVEILIDPRPTLEGTGSDIYTLQIKPNGVLVARAGYPTEPPSGKSEVWQSGAAVAVQVQRDAWLIELSLPLAALGKPALENWLWGFNVTRLDARRGEYSSWSGAHGNCCSPQSLGNLLLLRP